MALDYKLVGAAQAGPTPVDVQKAVMPALDRAEKIFAEQRARTERRGIEDRARAERVEVRAQMRRDAMDEYNATLITTLGATADQVNKFPVGKYRTANEKAIMDQYQDVTKKLQDPNLSRAERAQLVSGFTNSVTNFKANGDELFGIVAGFAQQDEEGLSELTDPTAREVVKSFATDNYTINEDGTFSVPGVEQKYTLEDLKSLQNLEVSDDKYAEMLQSAATVSEKYASKGFDQPFIDQEGDRAFDMLDFSDNDLMTIGNDRFGITEEVLPGWDNMKKQFIENKSVTLEDRVKLKDYFKSQIKINRKKTDDLYRRQWLRLYGMPKQEKEQFIFDGKDMLQNVYDSMQTGLQSVGERSTSFLEDRVKMYMAKEEDGGQEMDEEDARKQAKEDLKKADVKAWTTESVIKTVKNQPVFANAEIYDPASQEDIIKSDIRATMPKMTDAEVDAYYNKRYRNALMIVDGKPIDDINGLVTIYNEKLPQKNRLSNSEMQDIINSINVGSGTTPGIDNEVSEQAKLFN